MSAESAAEAPATVAAPEGATPAAPAAPAAPSSLAGQASSSAAEDLAPEELAPAAEALAPSSIAARGALLLVAGNLTRYKYREPHANMIAVGRLVLALRALNDPAFARLLRRLRFPEKSRQLAYRGRMQLLRALHEDQ